MAIFCAVSLKMPSRLKNKLKIDTEYSTKRLLQSMKTDGNLMLNCFSCFYEEDSPRCDQRPCTSLGNDKGTNKQLFIDENRLQSL